MESPKQGQFDATVSESKEESIAKAMEIMMAQINSYSADRVIVRPEVSVLKGLIPIILCIAGFVLGMIFAPSWVVRLLVILALLVVIALTSKPLSIWLILMYQRFAPEKVRKSCCFQPSCSEYMKLAIEKYGVVKGIYRGCKRLLRCHWPNGGVDYP